jgi:hypothetical protein
MFVTYPMLISPFELISKVISKEAPLGYVLDPGARPHPPQENFSTPQGSSRPAIALSGPTAYPRRSRPSGRH